MTTIVQVLAVIGFAVVALIAIGLAVTFLVLGAVVLEHLTGVPADQRRLPLERRGEHRARLHYKLPTIEVTTEVTDAEWQRLDELIAAEDARRAGPAGNVVSLESFRASRHRLGGAA